MQSGGCKKKGALEESYLDSGQENDENDAEELEFSDLCIVVPPPSHVMCDRALLLERQPERSIQWTPQRRRLVDSMLDEVYAALQPTREQQDARRNVIHFVDNFVKSRIQGSHIEAFGSFVMDMYTGSSDLDLSLNVGNSPIERSKNERIIILRKLTRALHGLHNGRNGAQRHTIRKIEPVMRAAVPVVKFVECHTNIECDVSMENRDGVLKSELLGIFALMDPRFRQLCFLLKAWAKAHNVNDSKKGTLNSLSIVLLAAFHLQTRSPPILPSFSVLLEGLVLHETEGCLAAVRQRVALYKERGFGRDNKETVSQLFASFFTKLLAVESLWEQGLCASTYEGKWVSKVWAKNHLGRMSVEDFAERSQNCARAVREQEFDTIHQCFRETVSLLSFATATVPQVAELKHIFFGFRYPKRPSEEPLVQPVEKQQKLSNGWAGPRVNSPNWSNSSTVADNYRRVQYSMAQPHQTTGYLNHNGNASHTQQQRDVHHGGQGYHDWAARGDHTTNFGDSNRGILSLMPGSQVPQYGAHGYPNIQQHLHSPQTQSSFPASGSLLGGRPLDGDPHLAYRAYRDGGAPGYHHQGGWAAAPGMVAATHHLHALYTLPSEAYFPQPFMYRSDGVRDQASLLALQRSNGIYDHPQQQPGHLQDPSRHSNR